MRFLVATMAFAMASACAAPSGLAQEQGRDLSGTWYAVQTGRAGEIGGGYFRAQLAQDDAGRLRGAGVVDPCTRCAGFMEYALSWEGGFEGDVLVLMGTPERVMGRHTIVRFEGRAEGDGFAGVLSGLSHDQTMNVLMERAPAGE